MKKNNTKVKKNNTKVENNNIDEIKNINDYMRDIYFAEISNTEYQKNIEGVIEYHNIVAKEFNIDIEYLDDATKHINDVIKYLNVDAKRISNALKNLHKAVKNIDSALKGSSDTAKYLKEDIKYFFNYAKYYNDVIQSATDNFKEFNDMVKALCNYIKDLYNHIKSISEAVKNNSEAIGHYENVTFSILITAKYINYAVKLFTNALMFYCNTMDSHKDKEGNLPRVINTLMLDIKYIKFVQTDFVVILKDIEATEKTHCNVSGDIIDTIKRFDKEIGNLTDFIK